MLPLYGDGYNFVQGNIVSDTNWQPDLAAHSGPKYLALARALRDAVRAGHLTEGARLPPVRDLAWRLSVTPGTVARAYQIATQEGLLQAAVGRGTFVAATQPRFGPTQSLLLDRVGEFNPDHGPVDMRSPQLPEVGQAAALAAAMKRVATNVGQDWLDYPNLRRDKPAREAVLGLLSDRDLGEIDADHLVLAHGGQNAISIVLQCCLSGDRPVVFAEELAYPGFRHAARLARADVVPIALDDQGMHPEALDVACRKHGGRIVCITTEAQNPTAARMGPERRAQIVAVARKHDLQIIEDDCYTVAATDQPALRALAPERTWHVQSLSKSISAGLRIGWVVCPDDMGEAGRLTAQHSFFGLSRPILEIVNDLIETQEINRLRAKVQAEFARRLEIVVAAFRGHDLTWQPGLSFVWLKLPVGWRASTFAREAEGKGVLIRSADEYALGHGHAPNAVRIAIAGGIPEARFARAIDRLAHLLDNPPGDLPV